MATYYFDASDAGPTDASDSWIDDADGFDGITPGTTADTRSDTETGMLKATGTNAPASGDAIDHVDARCMIATGGGGAAWETPVELSTPSGGWTWAKVQALHVECVPAASGTDDTIKVYVSDGGALLGTLYSADAAGWMIARIEVTTTATGIYLPTNADTTLYDEQVSNGATTLTFTVPSGVSDGDHLLIQASGDDDDVSWSPPSTTSGCGAWSEIFEYVRASDDMGFGAWWCLVNTASSASGQSVALVRTGSEELAGIMTVVQGAHADFEDSAGEPSVSTDNVDGSPDITPEPYVTTNDGAVVVIQDVGNSWGEVSSDTIVAPSGYTYEGASLSLIHI